MAYAHLTIAEVQLVQRDVLLQCLSEDGQLNTCTVLLN
jgi:hypothetical protein